MTELYRAKNGVCRPLGQHTALQSMDKTPRQADNNTHKEIEFNLIQEE